MRGLLNFWTAGLLRLDWRPENQKTRKPSYMYWSPVRHSPSPAPTDITASSAGVEDAGAGVSDIQ
jgi:hypothetical protein